MKFPRLLVLLGLSVLIWGCSSTDQYADPQKTGAVPARAKSCGVGVVGGGGARWTTGVHASEAGTFILVAGDEPILTQPVAAKDLVVVYVDHPLLGKCHIQLLVNNEVKQKAESSIAVFRAYFLSAE